MQPEQEQIARRAAACKGWRWEPGMRWRTEDDRGRLDDYQPEYMGRPPDALPDLTDPATLGCLLALVREAHGQSTLSPLKRGARSWCLADYGTSALEGETEVELLVAALESAP
jgi:hypothetical protein